MENDTTVQNISLVVLLIALLGGNIFLLLNPSELLWNKIFTPCANGFAYSKALKRCDCIDPFFGDTCEQSKCVHGVAVRGDYGWTCQCEHFWIGKFCDVCPVYDGVNGTCFGDPPYPNSQLCREDEYNFGTVEFVGPRCDTICVKPTNTRVIVGDALDVYTMFQEKAPLSVVGCPENACYDCHPVTGDAQCVDGFLKSLNSRECDLNCGPCTQDDCRPCSRRGECVLRGTPVCICDPRTRGTGCELLCPGITEVFNGIIPTLTGTECFGNGVCTDFAQCECLEDVEGTPRFIEDCKYECPVEDGVVCNGHGTCALNNDGAYCECNAGWFGDKCTCSDGSVDAKTCVNGDCNLDGTCQCYDDNVLGHWTGQYCNLCANNYFTEVTSCLQYCNPETTCSGHASRCVVGETVVGENGLVLPCTFNPDTGALEGTCARCSCDENFQDSYLEEPLFHVFQDNKSLAYSCTDCTNAFYPKADTQEATATICDVQCDSTKCSNRGACLRNSGQCACYGNCPQDATLYDGECLMKSFGMQPHFSQSSDCSECSSNWGPNVDLWQASCNFFCNPTATVDDDLPTDCYDSNGKVVNECVFCSGRASNCSSFTGAPTCNCEGDFTGRYCQNTCGSCNNGVCEENRLYNFFLIDVPEYEKDDASSFQCSCLSVDTEDRLSFEREMYTMVTYDLPQERAFLNLPERKDYYGEFCSSSCKVGSDGSVCNSFGNCESNEVVGLQGTRNCNADADCNVDPNNPFVEDSNYFCHLPDTPKFWQFVRNLQVYESCTAEEVTFINTFIDTHDWKDFCYNFMSTSIPQETYHFDCNTCTQLVHDKSLWNEIDSSCSAFLQLANQYDIVEQLKDCGTCSYNLAEFDWESWCELPAEDFRAVCPTECVQAFKDVEWVRDGGFCDKLNYFVENEDLQSVACSAYNTNTSCTVLGEQENSYDLGTACFVPRESVRDITTNRDISNPYSGSVRTIYCKSVSDNLPQVCGAITKTISHVKSTCDSSKLNVLGTGLNECELRDQEYNFCSAKHGQSFTEGNQECILNIPKCLYCGVGTEIYDTGVVLNTVDTNDERYNNEPGLCCRPNDIVTEKDGRYQCHPGNTYATTCRYDDCTQQVKNIDWKGKLLQLDNVKSLDNLDIPLLQQLSVKRSLNFSSFCLARKTLDENVDSDFSLTSFKSYCDYVTLNPPGNAKVFPSLQTIEENLLVELNTIKQAWWLTNNGGVDIIDYDMNFYITSGYHHLINGVHTFSSVTEFQIFSVWIYIPVVSNEYVFSLQLKNSIGRDLAQIDIRGKQFYFNNIQQNVYEKTEGWHRLEVYFHVSNVDIVWQHALEAEKIRLNLPYLCLDCTKAIATMVFEKLGRNDLYLHDVRFVEQGFDAASTYFRNSLKIDGISTLGYENCPIFLQAPSIENIVCPDNSCTSELQKENWGLLCSNYFNAITVSDEEKFNICLDDAACKTRVEGWDYAGFYDSYIFNDRPEETRLPVCNTPACDSLMETFDYVDLCQSNLRSVAESCSGCQDTFNGWLNTFNKKDFCTRIESEKNEVENLFRSRMSNCSSSCRNHLNDVNFYEFCNARMVHHGPFAPYGLTFNVSVECRNEIFSYEDNFNVQDDCYKLGTEGSVSEGKCHRVFCDCLQPDIGGDRCNIQCSIGSDGSACNERTNQGTCCLEIDDDLNLGNCQTDVVDTDTSLFAGQCLCFNTDGIQAVGGENCDTFCDLCSPSHGKCQTSGACKCQSNAFEETVRSNFFQLNTIRIEEEKMRFDWANTQEVGYLEGLANSQEPVLLLWTSEETCIKTDIDKCCVWDDFTENVMNPLHDDYDRNVITREGSGGMLCSSEFINECAKEAINNDEEYFQFTGTTYKITNPVKNWPLQNEIRISTAAKTQEPTNLYNPATLTQSGFQNSKCPAYTLVDGFYRVEAQKEKWTTKEETFDPIFVAVADVTSSAWEVHQACQVDDECEGYWRNEQGVFVRKMRTQQNELDELLEGGIIGTEAPTTTPSPTTTQTITTTQASTTTQAASTTQAAITTQATTATEPATTTQPATTQATSTAQVVTTTQAASTTTQVATTQEATTTQATSTTEVVITTTTTEVPKTTQSITTTTQPATTQAPTTTEVATTTQPPTTTESVTTTTTVAPISAVTLEFGNSGSYHYTYNGNTDPTINLCLNTEYIFKRTSSGHPLVVLQENDVTFYGDVRNQYQSFSAGDAMIYVNGNSESSLTFSTEGLYYYLCVLHTNMIGKINVNSCSNRRRRLLSQSAPFVGTTFYQKPIFTPIPVTTSLDVVFKNQWCTILNVNNKTVEGEQYFGFIDAIECQKVDDGTSVDSSFTSCNFPFFAEVDDGDGFTITKRFTDCSDDDLYDKETGAKLFDFTALKSEIRDATGIKNPKYCVSETFFQNITAYTRLGESGYCRLNNESYGKCTNNAEDLANCECGAETCSPNEYCYEKQFASTTLYECHPCSDRLSPSPEKCCPVGSYFVDGLCKESCDEHWACKFNQISTASGDTYVYEGETFGKGHGPKPELYCSSECWNPFTQTCQDCSICKQSIKKDPSKILSDTKLGGYHYLKADGSYTFNEEEGINIPFFRLCQDNTNTLDNNKFALSVTKSQHREKVEFIRNNRVAAANPSDHCGDSCHDLCPGVDNGVPCSGNGICNKDCTCSCFTLDDTEKFFLSNLGDIGIQEVPQFSVGSASASRSPYRGDACEKTCPGFEYGMLGTRALSGEDKKFIMDELICSGHGSCLVNDGGDPTCQCQAGFVSGRDGNCEFECPENNCNGHGACSVSLQGTSEIFVENLYVNTGQESVSADVLKKTRELYPAKTTVYTLTGEIFSLPEAVQDTEKNYFNTVKYLSQCPSSHPYVYNNGRYCCRFERVANGTTLNRRSNVDECSESNRLRCPSNDYYEGNSLFIDPSKATQQSSVCRKSIKTVEEESFCREEARIIEANTFSNNPDAYTCDPKIKLVSMRRNPRPYYDPIAVLQLGAGDTENVMYSYDDVHCSNIVASSRNSHGKTLQEQPQPITLLECATCLCQQGSRSGFWSGINCNDCSFGFHGESCSGTCAGVCGNITVGTQNIFYEDYQRRIGSTKPCDSPVNNDAAFYYTCPDTDSLQSILNTQGVVWDNSYRRNVFCQDGRNSPGSCLKCEEPFVGSLEVRLEEPRASCRRLECPTNIDFLQRVNRLDETYSINLNLATFYSNFDFVFFGKDYTEAYNPSYALSKFVVVDLLQDCPSSHPHKSQIYYCCDQITIDISIMRTMRGFFNTYHMIEGSNLNACASKALSNDMFVVNSINVGTFYQLSKGFFTMKGSICHIYLGFGDFDVAYIAEKSTTYTEKFLKNFLTFNSDSTYGLLMRAYISCDAPLTRNISFFEGSFRRRNFTTTVSTTYEFGCQYQNTYPSFTELAQDNITDGELIGRTKDPYTSGNPSVKDIIDVVKRDACVTKFFEKCQEGHEQNIQNPFLTFFAFMKVEEYIHGMFPAGADQTGRCNINVLRSIMFCPQCPRCSYTGSIPGLDFALEENSKCDEGYFPYCQSKGNCEPNQWQVTDDCEIIKESTFFELFDPVKQTIIFENFAHSLLEDEMTVDECAEVANSRSTFEGFFIFENCGQIECHCGVITNIFDRTTKSNERFFLYRIFRQGKNNGINVFEAYIQNFIENMDFERSSLQSWYVERMRQAIPDKYRNFKAPVKPLSNMVTEYDQGLQCACLVDDCSNFDVTKCVHFNPIQFEWELLWFAGNSGITPVKEVNPDIPHFENGQGAVLRTSATLKSDVEMLQIIPSECDEINVTSYTSFPSNKLYAVDDVECNKETLCDCNSSLSPGEINMKAELVRDSFGNQLYHANCMEKLIGFYTVNQCQLESMKRFNTYNGEYYGSKGYFAVERPQITNPLQFATTSYTSYNFQDSDQLTCFVYRDVDNFLLRSENFNVNDPTTNICLNRPKVTVGCARSSELYLYVDNNTLAGDTDTFTTCNEPIFIQTYRSSILSDTGAVVGVSNPLYDSEIFCYDYGPCFSTDLSTAFCSCRPISFSQSFPNLHYRNYEDVPLHSKSSDQWSISNKVFSTGFGFWTKVRDKAAGEAAEGFLETVFQTYKEDILNMCYDDNIITADEVGRLSNRELLENEYTQYHLLFTDIACPTFTALQQEYNEKTRGRFAASSWTSKNYLDFTRNIFEGTHHTLLQKISVLNENYNYFFGRGILILDSRNVDLTKAKIGDPNFVTPQFNVLKNPIPYESVIKRYCDSGEQPYVQFGPCLNLKGYKHAENLYIKHFLGEQFALHRLPLKDTDIPTAVVGNTILEHDTVILVADGGKFYAISDFIYEEEVLVDKDEFKMFTDTYDIRDAKQKAMFTENHRYNEHTCSPMPMNVNPFKFDPVYRVNQSLMMLRPVFEKEQLSFSTCQPRQESTHTSPLDHEDSWGAINICEDLTPTVNYAQSCTCPSGFANIRYVDNNQPFSLHGGCSSLPGDSKGLFVDYKKCHGRNDCQQYSDTPFCCSYDDISCDEKYKNLCVAENGLPALDTSDYAFCNRPFAGCAKKQRNGIAIDDIHVECAGLSDTYGRNTFNFMTDEWIGIDESLQYETYRSLYEGDDPSKGVVYIDGLPVDKMRSNYAFMTTGCYACTDGRYQDAGGKQECRACPGGKYSINVNNAWFEPYVTDNGYLHPSRGDSVFSYEWWKVSGYPAQNPYVWHEVNEWLVKAPERPYVMDYTGKWHYNPSRTLHPVTSIAWIMEEFSTSCHDCPDNFASIPLAQDHIENPDTRYPTFPQDAYRSINGQRNCLICPKGYDTGTANHLLTGISRTPSERCPVDFPFAASSKEYAPYYGSHCCASAEKRVNPYHFHDNITDVCRNYIRCGSEGIVDGFYCVDATKDIQTHEIEVRVYTREKQTCSYFVPTMALEWEENICDDREEAEVEGLFLKAKFPVVVELEYHDGFSPKSGQHYLSSSTPYFTAGVFSNIRLRRILNKFFLLQDASVSCNGYFIDNFYDIIFFNNYIEFNGQMVQLGFVEESSADEDCAMKAISWHHENTENNEPYFSVTSLLRCVTYTEAYCDGGCIAGSTGAKTMRVISGLKNRTDASCFFQSVLDKQEGSAYCRKCPRGKFSGTPGANCLPCAVGKYQDEEGQFSCKICENSKYQFVAGASSCEDCPAGSENAESGAFCNLCKAGTYSTHNSVCTQCPGGKEIAYNFNHFQGSTLSIDRHSSRVRNSPLINFDSRYDYTGVHGYGEIDIEGNFVSSYSPFFEALQDMQRKLHDEESDCQTCLQGYINPGGYEECVACPQGTYSSNGLYCDLCPQKAMFSNYMFRHAGNFACDPLEKIGGYFRKTINGLTELFENDIGLVNIEQFTYSVDDDQSQLSYTHFRIQTTEEGAKASCDKDLGCLGYVRKEIWDSSFVYQVPSNNGQLTTIPATYNTLNDAIFKAVAVEGDSDYCSSTRLCIGYYEKDSKYYSQLNMQEQQATSIEHVFSDYTTLSEKVAIQNCASQDTCEGISFIDTYTEILGSEEFYINAVINVTETVFNVNCRSYAEEKEYLYWDVLNLTSGECVLGNTLL